MEKFVKTIDIVLGRGLIIGVYFAFLKMLVMYSFEVSMTHNLNISINPNITFLGVVGALTWMVYPLLVNITDEVWKEGFLKVFSLNKKRGLR